MGPVTNFLINASNITVYLAGVYFLSVNEIQLGTLLAVIMYGQLLSKPIKKLVAQWQLLKLHFQVSKGYFRLLIIKTINN